MGSFLVAIVLWFAGMVVLQFIRKTQPPAPTCIFCQRELPHKFACVITVPDDDAVNGGCQPDTGAPEKGR